MPLTKQIHELLAGTRIDARKEIVELFLEEQCGEGKGDLSSKYEYTVENYDSYSILLKRPAVLNKGFDFVVHISGMCFMKNRKHTDPSHDDIINSLSEVKKSISTEKYDIIKQLINKIYRLEEIDLSLVSDVFFTDFEKKQRPIAIIILALKWLFIEQDVTYWNWSGRAMLMKGLKKNDLA